MGFGSAFHDHRAYAALHNPVSLALAGFSGGLVTATQISVPEYSAAVDAITRIAGCGIRWLNGCTGRQEGRGQQTNKKLAFEIHEDTARVKRKEEYRDCTSFVIFVTARDTIQVLHHNPWPWP